jgi:DNA-binding FadR family transcriptional regulator
MTKHLSAPLTSVSRGTATQTLAEALLAGFLRDGLRPGHRLPTEQELSRVHALSRPVIRQALKALALTGFIESRPRIGTVLKAPDPRAIAPFFGAHLALRAAATPNPDGPGLLADLAEARWALEMAVLPLSVQRRTPEHLADMQRAEIDLAEAIRKKNSVELRQADAAFHYALLKASGNATLIGLAELIGAYFKAAMLTKSPHQALDPAVSLVTLAEHRDIREALEARDARRAQQTLNRHLQRMLNTARKSAPSKKRKLR